MKKLVALMLSLIMLGCLAGCGGDKTNGGNDAQQGNVAGGEKETLVMATNAEFPPYEYHEGDQIVGIDAEIAAGIAEKLGMELEISDMGFDSILLAVQSGQADIGVAGMTITPERLENCNFSIPYATARQVVIVAEGGEITSLEDLAGKTIGVQTNTTGDIYATDEYGDEAMKRYNRGAEAVVALNQGMIDAVIIDLEPAKSFVANNEGLTILETEYATEEYAIALAKENTELLDQINTALQEMIDDGTVQAIVDKYISAE